MVPSVADAAAQLNSMLRGPNAGGNRVIVLVDDQGFRRSKALQILARASSWFEGWRSGMLGRLSGHGTCDSSDCASEVSFGRSEMIFAGVQDISSAAPAPDLRKGQGGMNADKIEYARLGGRVTSRYSCRLGCFFDPA